MKNLFITEFKRIWTDRKTQLLLLFYLAMLMISCVLRYKIPLGSYDCKNYIVKLNSLNFSPFIFYEGRFELLYIIMPIISISCICAEQASGAFRMYMIRPYKKYKFIVSKWLSLALTLFIFTLITLIVSTIYGFIFLPKASTVSFYGISHQFTLIEALFYCIAFYVVEFIISLSIIAIASLVGIIIPNSVMATIIVIAAPLALGMYIKPFEFLDKTTKYGFFILSNTASINFYAVLLALIILSLSISLFVWTKKDYRD